jgi:apolipoprotein N-acyltransferase
MSRFIYFALSLFLVGFGQTAWIPEAGLLAAAFGYALFWKAMLQWPKLLTRFFFAAIWFMAIHAIQLSWMTSTHYMGPLIIGVYAFLLLGLGVQFGLFSLFLDPQKRVSQLQCMALAGGFVLLEWMRLYFLTGFTWNPAGLGLGGSRYAIQLAALFGIYGLSFWVIWTNLAALAFMQKPTGKGAAVWTALVLFPYGFGLGHETWVKSCFSPKKYMTAALIDTGLKVEEKNRDRASPRSFIPPLEQWERVWTFLEKDRRPDLIVLPEAAFPYGTNRPFCPLEVFKERWKFHFNDTGEEDFPPLKPLYVAPFDWEGKSYWMVTNAFAAQTLANHFQADLIVGFDYDDGVEKRTNAAFLFRPHKSPQRYDKRILAPVAEYVPLQRIRWFSAFLARQFGIYESFDVGKEAKVFQSHTPIGVPICLEELYSGLVRDLRKRGAELLVGLSNDVWFPSSRLARQHFDHSRIRAVENGVYYLRSSNMGVTGGVDCFGKPIGIPSLEKPGAIYLSIPIFSYPTLFSFWGNEAILFISGLTFLIFVCIPRLKIALSRKRRKSCP